MKKFLPLLIVFSFLAKASSQEGIPLKEIFFQILNFSLFFGGLIYLLKKPVQNFFSTRRKDFLLFAEQAKKQKEEMETNLQNWQQKIKELEIKEKNIKEDVEKVGKALQAEKQKEVEDLKRRLVSEKEFFIRLESEKIKRESFKKCQGEIVKQARKMLEKATLDPKLQEHLTQEFFKQMEAAQ